MCLFFLLFWTLYHTVDVCKIMHGTFRLLYINWFHVCVFFSLFYSVLYESPLVVAKMLLCLYQVQLKFIKILLCIHNGQNTCTPILQFMYIIFIGCRLSVRRTHFLHRSFFSMAHSISNRLRFGWKLLVQLWNSRLKNEMKWNRTKETDKRSKHIAAAATAIIIMLSDVRDQKRVERAIIFFRWFVCVCA